MIDDVKFQDFNGIMMNLISSLVVLFSTWRSEMLFVN